MMRKLDQRGAAAMEFGLVAAPLFILMFAIFDFGRYAITMQSLRNLASVAARQNMIQCYTPAVVAGTSPSACTADYLTTTQKQDAAPFLYGAGLTPTMGTTAGATALTVTASLPAGSFSMIMPIWGSTLNTPSASTQIPF
ncbi:pilus assembly protein [Bradyrhizobium tropiciagri]|uniref:TadE/TadG family type IV pilus assembly protein n=1 Tax=Bradyrhizobium tropiciagri TaxID=312253 RepID=UPI001BAC756B|nr:TadE family protein [Bradyrhizobium tropiciagri]MBR0875474.1 pilus assembly protein [Bradyrhizobium tropiciagri]